MSRLVLAADLSAEFEPERVEIERWVLDAGYDERAARLACIAARAYYRVEREEWGDTPWTYCWPLAHLLTFEAAVLGTLTRDTFHEAHERLRREWIDANPWWDERQRASAAASAGRLF